ncbi:response regulator transcription factor [Amycolatopsis sp. CA-161197]|uniref:response regulator transcription factor n=1 Tax=Amycolatopsis sp. CA-161197 TaxID=3239922 RepID=UPI003D94E4C1
MRVLVVEDEPKMAGLLRRGLAEEGYMVDVAADGPGGFAAAAGRQYDVVVLDVMLPGYSGFEVCRRLRRDAVWVPVLMLTARAAVADRIHGLDGGADDYLAKPFHLAELFARLRALGRRGPALRPPELAVGDLRVDLAGRRCFRGDTEVRVTAKEFALLEAFLRHPGTVLTREVLLERCWDLAYESRSNVVEVHLRGLREKIDRAFGVVSLETVRGAGYRLRTDGGRADPRP